MGLTVIGDNGAAVDWWFMYKLPDNVKPKAGGAKDFRKTTGAEYLYFDADSTLPLAMSTHRLDQDNGALHDTLAQLYSADAKSAASLGWICYNDEIPGASSNDGRKGHSKGVLAFDLATDTAFWLLHSWPEFPDTKTRQPGAWNYGQTYLCIALFGVDAARSIAEQMYHHQEPQTYETRLPASLAKNDMFVKVATAINVNETDPPADITFLSKGGEDFRLMAKNRHWNKDFWIDLVGPHLKVDIDVETWRRGTLPETKDSDGVHKTADILYLNVEHLGAPYEWHYTKDHAKWGISETDDWVCVADINRQTSQEKRGGGVICFRNKLLWQSLSEIEQFKQ